MKQICDMLLGILFMTYPLLVGAQETFPYNSDVIRTAVYRPVDLVFAVQEMPQRPYDVSFGAKVTLEGQQRVLEIPGFYNGEGEYRIRFSPTQAGNWYFTTFSSLPELAGRKGVIRAAEADSGPAGGPIVVDPQHPQKFSYEGGAPYFALAFELDWLFALDYGNAEGIPRTEQIIGQVKEHGFNQVVMNVYAYDVGWKIADDVPDQYFYGRPDFSVFGGTNEEPDFEQLNIDFFRHFDRVIEHLRQQDIVAHLMIYVWNKKVNWPAMYSQADDRYFDYVIKRYQAYPNIIWDVSKEALDYGRCDIPYINERIERIRRLDAYDRLITVHDYEYCSREPDRVDFISIQNWRNDLYSLSLEALLLHADKPVMNIEHGGYELGPYETFSGNYTDPEACLVRNYECVFAGVYSTYYWQNTSWNIVIFDPFDAGKDFDPPRFEYYRHLQNLFQRYDFNRLYPTKPKLTTNGRTGMDNLASSGYPLSNGEDLYLYLVPAENFQINVVLPRPPDGQITATWFNPFTGAFQDGGTSEWGGWKPYRSPWEGIYSVLILKMK